MIYVSGSVLMPIPQPLRPMEGHRYGRYTPSKTGAGDRAFNPEFTDPAKAVPEGGRGFPLSGRD
jgi:hypothetical protein